MPIGIAPRNIGLVDTNISEVMYYLYLPVTMGDSELLLPPNVECLRQLIQRASRAAHGLSGKFHDYTYLSARKGWATPDNPLNRPGWHCDGFGTTDLNYVWWVGPGTRFAVHPFADISDSHKESLRQFEEQIDPARVIEDLPERNLFELTPEVVHATPLIRAPGCMRQYVKVSFSDHKYNLENNSHNHLFNYSWPMLSREITRNDTHAQKDYVCQQ